MLFMQASQKLSRKIVILDAVFSLDLVITAIGMVDNIDAVMMVAMVVGWQ